MAGAMSIDRRQIGAGSAWAMAATLAFLAIGACKETTPVEPNMQALERPRPVVVGSTVLIDAEGIMEAFTAIAVTSPPQQSLSIPQADALRRTAEREYGEESPGLREWLFDDILIPKGSTKVTQSLTALAKARNTVAGRPSTGGGATAIRRAIAADSNRQKISVLSGMMAGPQLAKESVLAAQRVAWASARVRRGEIGASWGAIEESVTTFVWKARSAEYDRNAKTGDIFKDWPDSRLRLAQALMMLPSKDLDTLIGWYKSKADKAATDRVVGAFRAANDRAARRTLVKFLAGVKGID